MRQLAVLAPVLSAVALRAAVVGDRRGWAYVAVVGAVAAAVAAASRRARFSDGVRWGLAAGGLLHLAGGLLPGPGPHAVLYDAWLLGGVVRFDQAVHLYLSAVAAVACRQYLDAVLGRAAATSGERAVIVGLMAMGVGAVVEVFEFLASHRPEGSFVGGFENMGWDLVFDLAGVVAALAWSAAAPSTPPPPSGRRVARTGRGSG